MAKKNNIARNIAIGVAAGVAVSMLKKENREKVKNTAEKAKPHWLYIQKALNRAQQKNPSS